MRSLWARYRPLTSPFMAAHCSLGLAGAHQGDEHIYIAQQAFKQTTTKVMYEVSTSTEVMNSLNKGSAVKINVSARQPLCLWKQPIDQRLFDGRSAETMWLLLNLPHSCTATVPPTQNGQTSKTPTEDDALRQHVSRPSLGSGRSSPRGGRVSFSTR